MKEETFSIRLPVDKKDWIRMEADKRGVSVSQFGREIFEKGLIKTGLISNISDIGVKDCSSCGESVNWDRISPKPGGWFDDDEYKVCPYCEMRAYGLSDDKETWEELASVNKKEGGKGSLKKKDWLDEL